MDFFGWRDVGVSHSMVLAVILATQYAFIFLKLDISKTRYVKSLRSWLYSCHAPCTDGNKTCERVDKNRGKNYGFDPNMEGESYRQYRSCLLTGWELSHFIFHMFLGYFYNIYVSQILSFGFEMYEHSALRCGSLNDLVVNFAGYCVGYGIRRALSRA